MSQWYIREVCVGHCYAWIWTGVYNSHGGLSLYLHASANLDTYILNLHAQSRATVCTLHGNMYSSSMCARLMFVSWYIQILLFFEQVCSTKMAIKLAFESLMMKMSANWSLQLGLHFAILFTEIGAVVQKLWYFEWDTSHSVKILSCICTQNENHCDLRKNTQFKIFLAESVSIQTNRASVNTI